MELIGNLVISYIRLQENADRERERYLKLKALQGYEQEAVRCRKKADALQKEALRLFREYQRMKRCVS